MRDFDRWKGLLLRAQNFDDDWAAFDLPLRLAKASRQQFVDMIDDDELSDLDDRLREEELSDWDIDMFTRHSLEHEFNDPWITVTLTFNQLRCRRFMGWLLGQLSPEECERFHHGASTVAVRNKKIGAGEMLLDPVTQLLPDANSIV